MHPFLCGYGRLSPCCVGLPLASITLVIFYRYCVFNLFIFRAFRVLCVIVCLLRFVVFMEFMMATSDVVTVVKDDRKVVIAALGIYESSVRRAMKSASAIVVAEAHGKVLVDIERVQALFR